MNGMTLTIKGLFGHFNYEIPLYGLDNSDGIPMSSGVTILTGPNGYGKTTILRMLEAVSKGDLEFFVNLKFEKIALRKNDVDDKLTIQKTDSGLNINGDSLSFAEYRFTKKNYADTIDAIIQEPSSFTSTNDSFFHEGNEFYSPSDIFMLLAEKTISNGGKDKVEKLQSFMLQYASKMRMIPEQRLLEIRDVPLMYDGKPLEVSGKPIMTQKVSESVLGLPEKLKAHFSAASKSYADTDTRLNASFPRRVLSQSADRNLSKEEFDQFYQDMNAKLRVLQENGISEFEQQAVPAFQTEKAGILRVFFDDFNEKHKAYEPLINKLTLFRKILDRRFRDFKRVEISREYGLRVRDIQTGENGDIIPLEKLSSGEQETLVLYYQLIFDTEPGTMLLIDEPEISLHIEWQMTFIDELKEIVRLNNLQAVVATHSESILDANWDIQVDLGALYQDERGKLHQ